MMAFNIKLTNDGRVELAKAEMGTPLEFNYVAIGDGLTEGDDNTRKRLLNQLYALEIMKISRDGTQIIVECDLNNFKVETGFYFRELGIYANNILYVYGNAGESADYVDKADSSIAMESRLRLVLDIGETANVIIKTQSTMYALQKDFDSYVNGIIPITNEEIDMIDNIMVEVEDFEGDISSEDIENILNN